MSIFSNHKGRCPTVWIARLGGEYVFTDERAGLPDTFEMTLGPVVGGHPMIRYVVRRVETGTRRRIREWYIFGIRSGPLSMKDAKRLMEAFALKNGNTNQAEGES